MKLLRLINLFTLLLISGSALAILRTSITIFIHPQNVLEHIGVNISSIDHSRPLTALFSATGFTIAGILSYLFIQDRRKGLTFLTLLFGIYALYRFLTILFHGSIDDLGRWLFVDSALFLISVMLLLVQPANQKSRVNSQKSGVNSNSKISYHTLIFFGKKYRNTRAA